MSHTVRFDDGDWQEITDAQMEELLADRSKEYWVLWRGTLDSGGQYEWHLPLSVVRRMREEPPTLVDWKGRPTMLYEYPIVYED